jgi:hypothetical protein
MRSTLKNLMISFLATLVAPLIVVLVKNGYLIGEASAAHQQKQLGVVAPFIFVLSCVGTLVVLGLTAAIRCLWPSGRKPLGTRFCTSP